MRKALTSEELTEALKSLPNWRHTDGKIVRDYAFPDFVAAMAFINQIATVAEEAGHHPDIDIRYNKVRLGLVTHDSGGITAADAKMAARIDTVDPPHNSVL